MQLERTKEQFTKGILCIPKGNRESRYLLFEFDSKKESLVTMVHNFYSDHFLPFYAHETMLGWHFLSFRILSVREYNSFIKQLKPLNPDCPLTTLRVKPNKWIGEKELWKNGFFDFTYATAKEKAVLQEFKRMLDFQFMGLMGKKYNLVVYPFDDKREKERIKKFVKVS